MAKTRWKGSYQDLAVKTCKCPAKKRDLRLRYELKIYVRKLMTKASVEIQCSKCKRSIKMEVIYNSSALFGDNKCLRRKLLAEVKRRARDEWNK
jgi:hypothetical protein